MEASQPNRYITPTLQANWNLAISDVIRCLNAGLIDKAWLALGSLYDLLPPKIQKKVRKRYENAKKDFEAVADGGVSYEEMVSSFDQGMDVLREHVRPLFREMYAHLYDGGYLQREAGPRTKVRGLDRIEEILG